MTGGSDVDEIVEAFLIESQENIEQLDQDLLALESDPAAAAPVASAFRALHTIKGTCAFFGFPHLETLSHQAETLLGTIRDGERLATPAVITLLLEVSDRIRDILAVIEAQGSEADEPNTALLDRLRGAVRDENPPAPAAAASAAAAPAATAGPEAPAGPDEPAPATSTPAPQPPAPQPPAAQPPAAQPPAASTAAGASVRVGVPVLDKLMGLVGELVLARNQILQNAEVLQGPLAPIAERIDQITSGLQETATLTRMQPVRTVFAKLPRTARDVAYAAGKDVQVLTEGEDTELDRTVLDAIRDPLTHLIRNAVDHGIEDPDTRRSRGKPAQGTVLLRGSHAGGQVTIEVIDDGAGIDHQRVLAKARERGLISAERAATITPRESLDLIFAAGFSTAAAVTSVSGRGVGMDVVRTNVEAIGGSVELDSRPGAGSTVRITLPLTLAIIPALVVRCGGQHFALPQASLQEVIQLGDWSQTRLEQIRATTVVRHRERLLPVLALTELLGLAAGTGTGTDTGTLVLLRSDLGSFGLVVDEVHDTVEIVVKPLHAEIRALGFYSAATILGDGAVALILDVAEVARHCAPVQEAAATPALAPPAGAENGDAPGGHGGGERHDYLVARTGTEVLALPLVDIDHVEEVEVERVEWVGGEPYLQHRGQLLRFYGGLDELSGTSAARFVAVVLHGEHPRTAVCVGTLDEVAHDVATTDDGMVVVGGRLARVLRSSEVTGAGRW